MWKRKPSKNTHRLILHDIGCTVVWMHGGLEALTCHCMQVPSILSIPTVSLSIPTASVGIRLHSLCSHCVPTASVGTTVSPGIPLHPSASVGTHCVPPHTHDTAFGRVARHPSASHCVPWQPEVSHRQPVVLLHPSSPIPRQGLKEEGIGRRKGFKSEGTSPVDHSNDAYNRCPAMGCHSGELPPPLRGTARPAVHPPLPLRRRVLCAWTRTRPVSRTLLE